MSSDRFHKAAKDGLLDVLKEATRKEVNAKDVDGMTPVLWAAFEGKLDALRLLVGRGGDADKSDHFGNTALHLAAAKGHLQCVDFLIKFGVNIYALDIDGHDAKDLAAINNRQEILRYLDSAIENFEISDRKKAKALKEQAQKNSEKRAKEYAKKHQKKDLHDIEIDVITMPHRPSTVLTTLKHKIWSGSQGNLLKSGNTQNHSPNTTKYSTLVGGTISKAPKGAVQRKAQMVQRAKQTQIDESDSDFKVGEIESSGKRSVRSLQGVRRDSEILYVGTYNSTNGNGTMKRGKITDVFDVDEMEDNDDDDDENESRSSKTMSRAYSQPDFIGMINDEDEEKQEMMLHRPSGLFDRPMLGSLAFPRSVTAVLSNLSSEDQNNDAGSLQQNNQQKRIKPRSQLICDSDSDGNSTETDDTEDNISSLERFLTAWSLDEYYPIFKKQEIDLDTLLLLTESDLKSLGLPLGPYRKLVVAIQERKSALTNPGPMVDSRL